jgi:hypothetical protein
MSSLFEDYANTVADEVTDDPRPIAEVDCLKFVTHFLGEHPTPLQRIVIKTLYLLWNTYPPDDEELKLLSILQTKWRIKVDLERTDPILFLVLVLGRRSTKSSLMSFLATYAIYTLICKGNPQKYYGIRERHPIFVTHVAAASGQAADVFTLTRDNIRKCDFFIPYTDFDRDNTTELRLFTPFDLSVNARIRYRNSLVPRGYPKENFQPGSLMAKSITTSSTSQRGEATFMLMLSEFAHFQRANIDPSKSADQAISENPRSDYAIETALVPSVKDFGKDGKVIYESSPAEKGGEFYHQYCVAGGMEQEEFDKIVIDPEYQVIQLATWEARPTMPYEKFAGDFRKNPRGANMEYGAHFGNPSGSFITEELIASIPQVGFPMILFNPNIWKFVVCVDAGGKAKSKKADTYAIGWGHADFRGSEANTTYWVDGFHGFDAKVKDLGGGQFEQVSVDYNEVISYIVQLVQDLGGRNYILEVCYDQWENTAAISALERLGFPAIETTFTNPYKASMYGNFLTKAQLGQVKMYGDDIGGWIGRWKLEMKYLQQDIAGNVTYYHHPANGPVQHDDFADVSANLVHRLVMLTAPTEKTIEDARRHHTGPMLVRKTGMPVAAVPFQRNAYSTGLGGRRGPTRFRDTR